MEQPVDAANFCFLHETTNEDVCCSLRQNFTFPNYFLLFLLKQPIASAISHFLFFFFFYFSRLFLPFQRKKLLLKLLILAFLDVIFRMSLLLRHSAALQRGQLCLVKDASGSQARFPGWQLVLGLAGILFCQCFSRHLLSVIFPIIAGSPLGLLPSASQ